MNKQLLEDRLIVLMHQYLKDDQPQKAYNVMFNYQHHGVDITRAMQIYQGYWNDVKKAYVRNW